MGKRVISNPLTTIEQITYLMLIKHLNELHITRECNMAAAMIMYLCKHDWTEIIEVKADEGNRKMKGN